LNSYPAPISHHSSPSCLKFLTYNIRVGAGPGHPLTTVKNLPSSPEILEKVAAAIASLHPEVVALQEVRGLEQARFLAEALDMNFAYCTHGRVDLDWGLAILSKFEIRAAWSEIIHPGRNPRIGLVASVRTPLGDILCVNLHYHVYGAYRDQVERTLELLEGLDGPAMIMGDLNFSGIQGELGPILKKWADACDSAAKGGEDVKKTGTVMGRLPYRLDYIFVDARRFRVETVGLMSEAHRKASDHIGYYACLAPL
jgi:endonuclease/exonuclease/phosphatase family metal-dependent hydrolase